MTFKTQAKWLIKKDKLSVYEKNKLAYQVLDDTTRSKIEMRLVAKNPNCKKDEYTLEMVDSAVRAELHGTSNAVTDGAVSGSTTTALAPGTMVIKTEDMTDLITKTLDRVFSLQKSGQQGAAQQVAQAGVAPRRISPGCHYCSDLGSTLR